MPIRPENKSRYPRNWREVRERIRRRAGDRCEWCGVPNGAIGYRNAKGEFREVSMGEADVMGMEGEKVIVIVCTTAHVHDPAPENCADENLAFLCQRCHLNHDRQHHNQMRVQNAVERDVQAGQMLLIEPKTEAP